MRAYEHLEGITSLRTPIPLLTSIKLISLLTLVITSVNGATHRKHSGTCECASRSYTNASTQDAIDQGGPGTYRRYPHRYENYEGSTLSCSGSTYYEFPILASGALFNGSTSPGPDRVVHSNSGDFCGCITYGQ